MLNLWETSMIYQKQFTKLNQSFRQEVYFLGVVQVVTVLSSDFSANVISFSWYVG